MVVSIDVILNTQLQVVGETIVTIIRNHNQLGNLDYENSGHTGFVSTKDLEKISNEKVSHYNRYIFEVEYDEEPVVQELVRLFQIGELEFKVNSFYNLYMNVHKSDYSYYTFYLTEHGSSTSAASKMKMYLLESNKALYRIDKTESYADGYITWSAHKLRDKVFSDSDLLKTKADVEDVKKLETQLELYTYTRAQIVAEYLSEYSRFIGQTVVSVNYTDFDRRTYEFLNANSGKWGWLKEWLISCRTDYETNAARLQLLLEGDETFWAYEMWAFINCTYRDEYPGTTDYTLEQYANGWKPSTTLEKLNDDINQLGIRVPTPPVSQGTYYLEVVVDENGDAIYSWKKQ